MASSGSSRAGSPIVIGAAALAVSASVHAGDRVLWDNGDTDGSGGYSNMIEHLPGSRRTLLDDFVVPDGERWRIAGLHHTHIWNTLPPGSGEGMEVCIRESECWVNYDDLGGLQPGDAVFGISRDLNWQVAGTIQTSACPEDLDDSGAVDFADLLTVLAAWGPCA